MVLVVENGTGLDNAESYVSVAEIDAYALLFGKTEWSAANFTETQKEVKARLATRYLDSKYLARFNPNRPEQSLYLPASDTYIRRRKVEGIPRIVKEACCELAVVLVDTDLFKNQEERLAIESTKQVGPLTKTEKFASSFQSPKLVSVELILQPLLGGSGSSGGVGVSRMNRV